MHHFTFWTSLDHFYIQQSMTLQGSETLRQARHVRLAQFVKHQTFKPVMVSCEFNSHQRELYFFRKLFKAIPCQFCTEMSDLCYLPKPQLTNGSPSVSYFHKVVCCSLVTLIARLDVYYIGVTPQQFVSIRHKRCDQSVFSAKPTQS